MILFAISEVARALGCTYQAVAQRGGKIKPSGKKTVNGTEADAFTLPDFPLSVQQELAGIAAQRGCRDALDLLTEPDAEWQPRTPWPDVGQPAQDNATKLRTVLLPFVERKDIEDRSQAQLEADGVAAYERVFGHRISGRWFRELYMRTIHRDRNHHDWMRLEIYLHDNVGQKRKPRTTGANYDHSALLHRLQFQDPTKPTITERQNALEYSFCHFHELSAAHPGQAEAVKRSVLHCLWKSAPMLARSPGALKRNWNRKYARWNADGRSPVAIQDLRTFKPVNPCVEELNDDLQLIVAEAFHHDGKLSIAIRKLRKAGKLSQAFTDRYTLDVRRNKSYVANSVRKEISARLEGVLAYRRSLWQVKMEGPRIAQSHDHYNPGDFFAADDVTFNTLFWFIGDDGLPDVSRGECLIWFDCRSLYPLGYVLKMGRYNGETIRHGILNIHDKHGLPHKSFVFEQGIWKSRLIRGPGRRDFLGWDEYEMGLRNRGLGLEVRNVTTPGAKLIEGIFNILEQRQRPLPGFVGFNARSYGQEGQTHRDG